MLPSNPRMGSRGLPSNPRPRSRSTVRPRDGSHTPRPNSRSSRPDTQRERSRTPPRQPLRQTDTRLQARSAPNSDDSASSTASSLLDRMRLGNGYASSHTSLEDEANKPYSTPRPQDTAMKSLRQRRLPGENQHLPEDSDVNSGTGDGNAIWNRVATVASTLTVSVSKAWATNISTFAGEETPPGQESRLTRAMKAYHLEKARDPTDLPPWLFDERERRRPVSLERTQRRETDESEHERAQSVNELPKSRGLRDIYDAYSSEAPISRSTQRGFRDDPTLPSKATDRLKALRDAKRSAAGSAPRRSVVEEARSVSQHDGSPKGVAPRQRLGLPSGPRRV